MTTILVCCAVLIVAVGGLYVLLCHEPFLAACWYRMFPGEDPYVPDAAEAPHDPEPRRRIVAGSDLDRHRRPIDQVNADFSALLEADPNLASLRDLDLSAYYVLPEGDR